MFKVEKKRSGKKYSDGLVPREKDELKWNPYLYAFYPTLCTLSVLLIKLGKVDVIVTYDFMWKISLVYFAIDLVVQFMAKDAVYIIHHVIALILFLMRLKWESDDR